MFSFFKRLIGKSTDTPEENKAEDVADSVSEGAEALRDPTTPVMPAQPVETLLEGGEAAVRTSETQARGADVGAGAGAPVQSNDGSARPADLGGSVSSVDLPQSTSHASGSPPDIGTPATTTPVTPA